MVSKRAPRSEAYARLGTELRRIREVAGRTTREVERLRGGCYGSGTISNIEAGYSIPSLNAIKAYARLGGDYATLLALLERAREAKPNTVLINDEFEHLLSNPRSEPTLLRRGYALLFEEDTAYFDARRVPGRIVYRAVVQPTSELTRFFVFRYQHIADPRRGVVSIMPGAACDVAHLEETDDGIVLAVLEFDPRIPDEFGRTALSWAIDIKSEIPGPAEYLICTGSRIAHLVTCIQFTPPAVPESIWWFRGNDPWAPRIEPAVDAMIAPNQLNRYAHEFYDLQKEACGVAWRDR